MSKGTILYVGGFELPDKNAAAHRVLSNGKILKELGYKVVFIGVDKNLNSNSKVLSTSNTIQGFECWSISYPKNYREWVKYITSIEGFSRVSREYNNVELIIAYNYPALALMNLKRFSVKNNIKLIGDCTEWYSTKGANVAYKLLKGTDSFLRMRILQKRLDGLIVISKYLEDYYKNCENVVRIPPLVDKSEEKWICNSDAYSPYSLNENRLKLIYLGSTGKNKDKINYIIDALWELRDYNNYVIDIVGLRKEQFIKYYPEYRKKVEDMNKSVFFSGRISHEESLSRLKNADYSIFIRDKSRLTLAGFPTKFVESISCSTPVITNDSSDISEYFENDSNGFLITDFSTEKLVEVLKTIVNKDAEVENNQSKIDSQIFHYGKYEEVMANMLNNIMK